jgi:hypothetical protein
MSRVFSAVSQTADHLSEAEEDGGPEKRDDGGHNHGTEGDVIASPEKLDEGADAGEHAKTCNAPGDDLQ